MSADDSYDHELEEALREYTNVAPSPGSIERWLHDVRCAAPPRRRMWPAAAVAALLVAVVAGMLVRVHWAVPAQSATHRLVVRVPPPASASVARAAAPARTRAIRPYRRRPVAAWRPFPLPRPMTAEEAYALALAQSSAPAPAPPPPTPDVSDALTMPELTINPLPLTPTDTHDNKDGNP